MLNNIVDISSKYGYMFVDGVKYTLMLSFTTVLFGFMLGSLLALCKMSKLKVLNIIAGIYIEIVRGTPLLLQLYLYYFLLPEIFPFMGDKYIAITVALALNSAAYVSEIIRAGIQAVPIGQTEASRSLGLSMSQTMLRIILPQAIKNILPALCNEFIMVIKETSLASTFFIGDIMTQYKAISGFTFLVIEPLIIAGVIYFVLTFSLSKFVSILERKLKESD